MDLFLIIGMAKRIKYSQDVKLTVAKKNYTFIIQQRQ